MGRFATGSDVRSSPVSATIVDRTLGSRHRRMVGSAGGGAGTPVRGRAWLNLAGGCPKDDSVGRLGPGRGAGIGDAEPELRLPVVGDGAGFTEVERARSREVLED
jgi:hypothetical protein